MTLQLHQVEEVEWRMAKRRRPTPEKHKNNDLEQKIKPMRMFLEGQRSIESILSRFRNTFRGNTGQNTSS